MKKIGIFLAMVVSIEGHSQQVKFEIKFSEPLAVFQFMNSLSSQAPDNVFKKLFARSGFASKKYAELIARFDSLDLSYGYEFTAYPPGQKVGGDISNFLRRNLVLSDSLQDFKLRSMGLVPNETLIKLLDLLKEFTPIYEEVVYEPSRKKFEEQLQGITDLIKSTNINYYFGEALQFYNSSWDVSIPFVFSFYPLPNSRGFTATAISNLALSAVADSLDSYNVLLSVMLHEISHVLYDERSLSLWNQSDSWFNENPSRCSGYARSLFNEAMASAVGNGYLGAQLYGKEDTSRRLYGVKYINLVAKASYLLVKEYISKSKPIDRDFVNRYIQVFEDHFSGWISDPAFLFFAPTILSEDPADFEDLKKAFSIGPNHDFQKGLNSDALKKLATNQGTKMIIVSHQNREKLKLIREIIPALSSWKFDPGKDFVHSVFLKDKTWLIIINNVNTGLEEKLQHFVVREGD